MTTEPAPKLSPATAAPPRRGSAAYLILICFVATLGGLLFGYDTAVISGAIGFMEAHFGLSPAAVGWAASSALAGCVLGCALAGLVSDYLGRKKVLVACALLFLVSAIGTAIPQQLASVATLGRYADTGGPPSWVVLFVFSVFRLLGGVGVGAASMTSPMYIAEVSPASIRGRMVSLNQLAIVSGMLVVFFVNYFIAASGDEAWNQQFGWRWMFASESIPAVALLVFLLCVPESPRWLAKQARRSEAFAVLERINGSEQAGREVAAVEEAIALESGSIAQLFEPGVRMVLVIGVALAVLQQVTGINVFLYFGPELFKGIAGSRTDVALLQTIVVGAVNLTFTIVAIWTVDRVGRKPLMLVGFAGMGLSLLALGLAAYIQRTDTWVLTFILTYMGCFALSVGPVTWVILSEIFPTRVRGRAMAMATVCLWVANLIVSQTFPMLDKNEYLLSTFHHAFPFWVYGLMCAVAIVFVALYVPETKQRSLEEIEKYWLGGHAASNSATSGPSPEAAAGRESTRS